MERTIQQIFEKLRAHHEYSISSGQILYAVCGYDKIHIRGQKQILNV